MSLISTISSVKTKIEGRHLQFIAHWVYILMSLSLYQSHRPIYAFTLSYLAVIIFFYVGKKYISEKYFNHTYLSALVVANSTYLNILYNYEYILLLPLSVFLAINIKLYFRRENSKRSMFNPSLTSIFILSLLFPNLVTYGPNLWASEWWQILTVVVLGCIVTWYAKTLILSVSYVFAYLAASFLFSFILEELFPKVLFASPLSWILGLFSMGKLIYIFHVISDPQSGPQDSRSKIIFGASIAVVEIIMKYFNILNNVVLSYMVVLSILQIIQAVREHNQMKSAVSY